jgi:hypothetical protein
VVVVRISFAVVVVMVVVVHLVFFVDLVGVLFGKAADERRKMDIGKQQHFR